LSAIQWRRNSIKHTIVGKQLRCLRCPGIQHTCASIHTTCHDSIPIHRNYHGNRQIHLLTNVDWDGVLNRPFRERIPVESIEKVGDDYESFIRGNRRSTTNRVVSVEARRQLTKSHAARAWDNFPLHFPGSGVPASIKISVGSQQWSNK
jgi:hypothetical protein